MTQDYKQTSETVDELMKALAKAQSQMRSASKDATNPHFKSKYADLAEVITVVREAFSPLGLCFVQPTGLLDGSPIVITRVYLGNQYIEGLTPIIARGPSAQDYGAALTYARRQGLQSLVGVPAEDDDGNHASRAPQASQRHSIVPEPEPSLNTPSPFDFNDAPGGIPNPLPIIPVPCSICGTTLKLSKAMTSYYCPNFKSPDHKNQKPMSLAEWNSYQHAGEDDVP